MKKNTNVEKERHRHSFLRSFFTYEVIWPTVMYWTGIGVGYLLFHR